MPSRERCSSRATHPQAKSPVAHYSVIVIHSEVSVITWRPRSSSHYPGQKDPLAQTMPPTSNQQHEAFSEPLCRTPLQASKSAGRLDTLLTRDSEQKLITSRPSFTTTYPCCTPAPPQPSLDSPGTNPRTRCQRRGWHSPRPAQQAKTTKTHHSLCVVLAPPHRRHLAISTSPRPLPRYACLGSVPEASGSSRRSRR